MRQLGNAAHLLGVRPWEWSLLTVEEADHLLDWLDAYEKQQAEATERIKR
ncbi:hypothetical protein [Streptomyces carpaticus]